jgi:hypothetical protein
MNIDGPGIALGTGLEIPYQQRDSSPMVWEFNSRTQPYDLH